MNLFKKVCVVILILFFAGCNEKSEDPVSAVLPEGEDIILALVNDSPVTEYELNLTIQKTIGQKNASKLGEEGRKKVLESLVASRAIAQAFEKDMSPEEGQEVVKKVQAYREQILVQKYIAKNASPQPVTREMVKEYYETHPERFGAKTEKIYEMISTNRGLRYKERALLLKTLINPETKQDWQQWTKELENKKIPVFYKKGKVVKGLLHPELDSIINKLNKGKVSKLHFIDERPYIIRIIDEKKIKPRPLTEVSTQIRKTLGPVHLKKVVKQISADVLKTAKVEYK